MPIRRFNYTGRRRLTADDVEIKLHDSAEPLSFEITKLSLRRHDLEDSALIYVEAYRQTSWMRFPVGTVAQPHYAGLKALSEFDSPYGILFRVKVTSASPSGLLLAERDHIIPQTTQGPRESLLPVRPDPSLEHEVFRVDFSDSPVLLVNGKLTRWQEITTDPVFASLAYPNVLRTILTRILCVEKHTDMEDDDWQSQWLRFARNHPNVGELPQSESQLELEEWVDQAVDAFCKGLQLFSKFSQHWDEGVDL